MKCFIVSFQLASPTTAPAVKERLKSYRFYCPINETCWAIMTEDTAAQVRDNVGQALASIDRIFVVRSGTESAWRNAYGPENSEWLKKNL